MSDREEEIEQAEKDRSSLERFGKGAREKNQEYGKVVLECVASDLDGNPNQTLRLFNQKEKLREDVNNTSIRFFEEYKKVFHEHIKFRQ